MIILKKWTSASVQVVYYIPDYPRITRFLDYWDKNIDGPIKEVYIHDHDEEKIRMVDRTFKIN